MDESASKIDDLNARILELAMDQKCCAQIVMTIGLEKINKPSPELIQAMRAACYGFHGNNLCGTLVAGSCLLSLCHEYYSIVLIPELFHWFKEKYGSLNCLDIVGIVDRDPTQCINLMAETYCQCFELLKKYGVELE